MSAASSRTVQHPPQERAEARVAHRRDERGQLALHLFGRARRSGQEEVELLRRDADRRHLLEIELRLAVEDLDAAAHAHDRAGRDERVDSVRVIPHPALQRAAPVAQPEPEVRLVLPGAPQLAGLDVVAAGHAGALSQLADGRPGERVRRDPLPYGGPPVRAARPALRGPAPSRAGAPGRAAHRGPVSRSHTIRPPTMVSAAWPTSRQPANGVLRLLERKRSGSTVHAASRSMTVTSAGDPSARVPPGRRNACAGAQLMRSTSWLRVSRPLPTSSVSAMPSAVSRPTMPNGASSKACSFSS